MERPKPPALRATAWPIRPHADDAEALAPDPVAQHGGGRPALPVAAAQQPLALGEPARHREDQRHGHVRRVLGQHPRRVGHQDAALPGRGEVDVIDAGAEARDQLEVRAGLADQVAVDGVRHRRHEHVGLGHGLRHRLAVERPIVLIESGVEKLHHARLDLLGETPRHDHLELSARPHRPSARGSAGSIRPQSAACLANAPWRLKPPVGHQVPAMTSRRDQVGAAYLPPRGADRAPARVPIAAVRAARRRRGARGPLHRRLRRPTAPCGPGPGRARASSRSRRSAPTSGSAPAGAIPSTGSTPARACRCW